MSWLKQSTAATVVLGPFVDDTDFKTAETALTIAQADIRLSKNGGAFAQTNNAAGASHLEGGDYGIPLDTTDTNTLGRLRVRVAEAGALVVWADFMVVTANVWDSLFGADKLQVHADEITAGLITAAAIADGAIDAATFAAGAINAAAIAADAITDAKVAADVTIASVTGAVGSVTGNVGGNVTGSVGSVAAGGIAAASFAAGAIDAAAIAANAIGASELAADAVAEIADAVWDEAIAGHLGVGSTGEQLAAAGAAGDPWATALPGAYGAGSAGKIVGDNLNATVSSRATQASVDTVDDFLDTEVAAILAAVDTEVAAILADTNELQTDWTNGGRLDLLIDAIKASTDPLTLTAIADALLKRDFSAVSGEAARSMLNALRALRNRVDLDTTPGTMIVTKEDDTEPAWTAALTTNAAAEPITIIDPA